MQDKVLSDDAVISKMKAAELLDLHHDTLDRMHRRGEGPPRVQLTSWRVGYRMRDLRKWLNDRAG